MYIFISSDGLIYNSPDVYVLSQKNQNISWGDTLKVYPVYKKGDPTLKGYQEIYAMFSHEGSFGSLDDTQWIASKDHSQTWYKGLNGVTDIVNNGRIVYFDLGPEYPKYYLSKEDLIWYITHIYNLYLPLVNDEYYSEE